MNCRRSILVSLLSAIWLIAATAGLLLMADYDSRPGDPGRPPQHWPSGVSLVRNSLKPTLMLFLHSRCPCSRASLTELARMAHSNPDELEIFVVFVQPSDVAADWSHTEFWENAIVNRDLHVVIDQGKS